MHRNAMQLAAIAMSSPIVTDTLPPVGLEQVLRPSRRHSLEMHPQDIELVIDTEAHIGLRDDLPESERDYLAFFEAQGLPNPRDLEAFMDWTNERGFIFDLADWLDSRRVSLRYFYEMFTGRTEPFWWTPLVPVAA